MIKFVLGPSGCGKTAELLEDMKQTAAKRRFGEKGLLCYLVPEQFSLHSEKMLLSSKEAAMDIQVLSFNRLAYRLFASIGGPSGKLVGEIGKQMIVRKILADVHEELVFYKSSSAKPGFILEVADLLSGLGEFRVTPSDLKSRGEKESPHFAAKLKDTALILERYLRETRENYLIGDEIPELLCKKLENYKNIPLPLLDGAYFWLDGFSGFTAWEVQIIEEIMKRAKKMVVSFTLNNHITTRQQEIIDKISQGAKDVEKTVLKSRHSTIQREAKNSTLPSSQSIATKGQHENENAEIALSQNKSKELDELKLFFEESIQPSTRRSFSDIHIIEAAEPYAECLAAAETVRHLQSECGYGFRDIAVVTDSRNVYEKNLVSVFGRLNIPLFVDTEESLLAHPLSEFVLSALDIVLYGRRYEDVFRFLKTGLTPLHEDDVFVLENYVNANGISSYRWQYEFKTKRAEGARNTILGIMAPLWSLTPKKSDLVVNFAKQVFQMLENSDVRHKLGELATKALQDGRPAEARMHTQVWRGFCEVFDKYVEILGSHKTNIKTFSDSLKAGFAKTRLGRIPPTSNQVMLGDTNRSRYPDIKAMIVLGANEGSFPPKFAQSGLFSENEKRLLKNSGMDIGIDRIEKSYEQDYNIYRTLTKPSEKLFIIYPRLNAEGRQTKPARVTNQILAHFPHLKPTKSPEYTEFGLSGETSQINSLSFAQDKLLADNVFSSSITRLESYAKCPYLYFMRYVLGARERDVYEILPRDLGKYFHEVLAGFTRSIMEANRLPQEEEIMHLTRELTHDSIKDSELVMGQARNRHIAKMFADTVNASCSALVSHLKLGRFTPLAVEEGIDFAIPLEGGNLLRIYGRIDRVDINAENYVKVIDYKSSDTSFTFSDVTNGVKLQLMLYLKSVATGDMKPGGAFYFTLQNPILDTDTTLEASELKAGLLKCFKMNGVVSENLVQDMDQSLASGESVVVPVRLKKDGGFWKNNTVLESGRMALLLNEAVDAAKNVTGKILSGEFLPEPYKTKNSDPCRFCEFVLACNGGRL